MYSFLHNLTMKVIAPMTVRQRKDNFNPYSMTRRKDNFNPYSMTRIRWITTAYTQTQIYADKRNFSLSRLTLA